MTIVPLIPDNAPFSAEQRSWLNGFLAGMLSRGPALAPGASGSSAAKRALLIAFGSQSGNAESFAKRLAKQAIVQGFAAEAAGLDSLQASDLVRKGNVLIVTSTWGEGDMPDNAVSFWEALNQNGSSPALGGVQFSVLALGDKNYGDTFCLAGRRLDERLEQLGATRVHPRVDCDVDFDEPAKQWGNSALQALLNGSTVEAPAGGGNGLLLSPSVEENPASWSKKNPFSAPLIANIRLNGADSAKDTRHIAFSLAGSGLSYETGDALGVQAQNDPATVDAIIAARAFDATIPVILPDGGQAPLREALLRHYEVRSWLGKAPEEPQSPAEFVDALKKLQPRLYSIASSLRAHPDEVHLCIGVVRYERDGVPHQGVASTFLADRLGMGETTGVFVHTAKHFRVPASGDTPMIMVGPGTGIAPFRAFLEERQATGATGRNWLFFGDQKSQSDFLYREQITAWHQDGLLTRLDLAFSRDQSAKIYVQNRMTEQGAELWRWLDAGAHFYVCGDASRMAKDVDAALHGIIQEQGGRSADEAAAYVADMKQTKRYARDVY